MNYIRDRNILSKSNNITFIYPNDYIIVDYMFVITNDSKHSGGATSLNNLINGCVSNRKKIAVVSSFNLDVSLYENGNLISTTSLKEKRIKPAYTIVDFWTSRVFFDYDIESKKVLFVQDRDFLFYSEGDCSLVVQSLLDDITIHKVTLGDWIPNHKYFKNFNSVPFPFVSDKKELCPPLITENKNIKLCAFFKLEQKRLPYFLLENLKALSETYPSIEINVFGDSNIYLKNKYNDFIWHGFLDYPKMMTLLESSDIGVVCSVSNISLLPFEMLSCGLITIQNESEVIKHFFGEEGFFFDPSNLGLVSCVESLFSMSEEQIKDKSELMLKIGKSKTANWDEISEKFCHYLP